MTKTGQTGEAVTLKRGLTLPLLTLYGLGVTIGAGIYVLVGAVAAKAGIYAPVSFVLAAGVVSLTALSYAELGTRYPVSAGEAAYVRQGFSSRGLSLFVGLMVAASGVVSSAAVSIGAASYLTHFVALPPAVLTAGIIILLGFAAAWGIVESVMLAAAFTLLEIGGLGLVIYQGFSLKPDLAADLAAIVPPFDMQIWTGIFSASLLAFFAFVGFEDIANVAEEVKNPGRTMPWAILLTLVISTFLYIAVVTVAVLVIPMDKLASSSAPLALLFQQDGMGRLFTGIAVIATVNGVLVQMIMASRVIYGLAAQNSLPALFRTLNPRTRTPLAATALVVVLILILALFFPIAQLAEATSRIVLTVFALVNMALIRLKSDHLEKGADVFTVPGWVPVVGFVASLLLLLAGAF